MWPFTKVMCLASFISLKFRGQWYCYLPMPWCVQATPKCNCNSLSFTTNATDCCPTIAPSFIHLQIHLHSDWKYCLQNLPSFYYQPWINLLHSLPTPFSSLVSWPQLLPTPPSPPHQQPPVCYHSYFQLLLDVSNNHQRFWVKNSVQLLLY